MALVALLGLVACGEGGEGEGDSEDEFGALVGEADENGKTLFEASGWEEPIPGKEDSLQGRRGLSVNVDSSDLSVWEIKNQWTDTDTEAARAAGLAWGEDSGLNWDEKFQRWVGSMKKIDAESYGSTFMLTTPFGREVPAPALECAEVAMFLRVTFASWYNLPFFMEARDSEGNRLYFGHFGIRTAAARYGRMPYFRSRYEDYSEKADAIRAGEAEWPTDAKLAGLTIPGSQDDAQPMLGEDAHAGAYFDHIYLNKRVGYFMRLLLTYFGSMNLADSANTYNLAPEAVQPGDVLLERWQRRGIGHALVVMRSRDLGVTEIDGEEVPQLEAELASGSMPRRQPKWESPAASKRVFTLSYTGGEGYEKLGGGLKRFRSAVNEGGRWTNVVLRGDRDAFISNTDYDAIAERPDRFEVILSELSPEEKLVALVELVESKRQHLRRYPASCSARIGREQAFDDLYETAADPAIGWSKDEVDRRFRKVEDYVFAELVYDKSKTCCWNSTNSTMYDVIMELNETRIEDPETGQCQEVLVFMNRDDEGDGYQLFADFAEATGRGDAWVKWSEDEFCAQRDVAEDTLEVTEAAPLCSVYDELESRM